MSCVLNNTSVDLSTASIDRDSSLVEIFRGCESSWKQTCLDHAKLKAEAKGVKG